MGFKTALEGVVHPTRIHIISLHKFQVDERLSFNLEHTKGKKVVREFTEYVVLCIFLILNKMKISCLFEEFIVPHFFP